MSLTLPLPAGSRVVITHPGRRVAELIHPLTEQGATVVVRTDAMTASEVATVLTDLASRRLCTVDPGVDPTSADLVVRDPLTDARAEATDHLAAPETSRVGRVTLVGGGPGDPGLLTLAGLEAITRADVIVCDRLAPLSVLARAKPDAQVIHVGKIPRGAQTSQEAINATLVEHALAGQHVVRLKGGDNYVFGRGGEEVLACAAHGIAVEVIPGVSSSIAVPALAGIPLTHRGVTQGFVVVTGHVDPDDPRNDVDWAGLARSGLTLVILMGAAALPHITAALIEAGLDPETPAACIADGSLPSQRQIRARLADLADAATTEGITPPAVTVIGPVVAALDPL